MTKLLVFSLFSILLIGQNSNAQSAEKKICRCEGNGVCELQPILNKKNASFSEITISKSNERDYTLIETTRLKKENVDVVFSQGGCDHTWNEFKLKVKESPDLNGIPKSLEYLITWLDLINTDKSKEMSKIVKKALPRLSEPKKIIKAGVEQLPPYYCETDESGSSSCTFEIMPQYSNLEITITKENDKRIFKLKEIIFL